MIKVGVTAAIRRHGLRCSAYFKVNHRGDATGVVKSLHDSGDVRVSNPESTFIIRTQGDTEVVLQCWRLVLPSTPLFQEAFLLRLVSGIIDQDRLRQRYSER